MKTTGLQQCKKRSLIKTEKKSSYLTLNHLILYMRMLANRKSRLIYQNLFPGTLLHVFLKFSKIQIPTDLTSLKLKIASFKISPQ